MGPSLLSRLPHKPLVLGLGALGLAITLTSAALLSDGPAATTATLRVPADDQVLAHVDPDARSMSRAVGQLAAGDVRARVELARRWIARARRSADPRHLGRAQAALAPWWTRSELPDEVRLLRATIQQSLHDFASARRDLDVLMVRRPDDLQLHLTRAAVATVTADYDAALASCAAVAAIASPLITAACKAPVQLVLGQAAAAYDQLLALDAAAPDAGPEIRAWVATSLGELAASRGDVAAAERHLRSALALAPDVYTKAALADLLLAHDRAAEVPALLGAELEADGLLLRLTIAEHRLGRADAAGHADLLRERIAATVARGDFTHRREQGMFELDVLGQPALALEHLLANWQLQKEPIDALLLLRAAAAAGEPEAAAAVRAWIAATAIGDVGLATALRALTLTREPS